MTVSNGGFIFSSHSYALRSIGLWDNLKRVFFEAHQNQYAPITELNFLFIYSLFKLNPLWFHLASLLWHIGCVILAYRFIQRILQMNGETLESDCRLLAFVSAFLFAIHPMNVEPVAWLSAVKVPIYVFFYLAGLLFYLRYIQKQKTSDYVWVVVCFICSCMGKEQAVSFPICLILIDWFTCRNLKSFNLWVEKLMFFCIAIFFGVIAIIAQTSVSEGTFPFKNERLFLVCYAFFEYITKGILPFHLNYLYPYPLESGAVLPLRFYVYPLLVAGLGVYLYTLRKNRIAMFGMGMFLVNLLFSLNIIDMYRATIVADRYFYLSGLGLFLFGAHMLLPLVRKWKGWKRYVFVSVCTLYILYLGGYTVTYSMRWKNMDTIQQYMKESIQEKENIDSSQKNAEANNSN